MPKFIQKWAVITFLIALMVSAFIIRLQNFEQSRMRSIDEMVYYRMSIQVQNGWENYHTIPYGQELADSGRDLPDYFFAPLYKHPPFFTWLLYLFVKIFGQSFISVGYVSILLSVFMIPLIYSLGRLVYDQRIGIAAALFLWMDPVSTITSQKVWPDTTLAFLTLTAVYFFIKALKFEQDRHFIISSITIGLTLLTKYTGILILTGIFLYMLIYQRHFWKKPIIWVFFILPLMMLVPWFYCIYRVYGGGFFIQQAQIHVGFFALLKLMAKHSIFLGTFLMIIVYLLIREEKNAAFGKETNSDKNNSLRIMNIFSYIFLAVFFFCIVPGGIMKGLNFYHLPTVTWAQGILHGSPPTFYFTQLMEFSPFYILAYLALFRYDFNQNMHVSLLRICTIVIILFFIAWTAYQSRYILGAIPFLIIIGWGLIFEGIDYLNQRNQNVLKYGLFTSLLYIAFKTAYVNAVISFPNDMCYF